MNKIKEFSIKKKIFYFVVNLVLTIFKTKNVCFIIIIKIEKLDRSTTILYNILLGEKFN